jgi:hypothetical protein
MMILLPIDIKYDQIHVRKYTYLTYVLVLEQMDAKLLRIVNLWQRVVIESIMQSGHASTLLLCFLAFLR